MLILTILAIAIVDASTFTNNFNASNAKKFGKIIGDPSNVLNSDNNYVWIKEKGNKIQAWNYLIENAAGTINQVRIAVEYHTKYGTSDDIYSIGYYILSTLGNYSDFNSTLTKDDALYYYDITPDKASWNWGDIKNMTVEIRYKNKGPQDNLICVDYIFIEVNYTPPYIISGYILNANDINQTIEGATIKINTTPELNTTSNLNGYYSFNVLNGTYLITASKTGYLSNFTMVPITGASKPNTNITLTPIPIPSYNLSGHIYNASDFQPIAEATVEINLSIQTATTNDTGYYLFRSAPNGTYNITASALDYESNSTTITIIGSDANLDIYLTPISPIPTPKYKISGYITNANNNVPIQGANVSINTTPLSENYSDVYGYYQFSNISNGTYTILAWADGYNENLTTVEILGNDKTNINLTLTPIPLLYNVSGFVLNASDGLPIESATILINNTLNSTDANGYYLISNLANGTYSVNVTHPDYYPNNTTSITITGLDVFNHNITLTPIPTLPPTPTPTPTPTSVPAIISWGNNQTNDNSLSISVEHLTTIEFNATANQTIANWYWGYATIKSGNGTADSNATKQFTSTGTFYVSIYGTNANGITNTNTWTISVVDNTPPTQVSGLTNDTPTQTTVNLSWTANTEDDLWGYEVFKNDSHLAYTQNAYYNVTGLTANTIYEFKVRANDTSNNWGLNSTSIQITTSPTPIIQTYNISGYVMSSTGTSISGATMMINTTLPSTTTNAAGYYSFASLADGTYLITASATGYYDNSTTVAISGSDVINVNITLTQLPEPTSTPIPYQPHRGRDYTSTPTSTPGEVTLSVLGANLTPTPTAGPAEQPMPTMTPSQPSRFEWPWWWLLLLLAILAILILIYLSKRRKEEETK